MPILDFLKRLIAVASPPTVDSLPAPTSLDIDAIEARAILDDMLNIDGVLRIITNECVSSACQGGYHDETAFRTTNPRHFVIHAVTHLEDTPEGLVAAHTADGDWCLGYPADLLRRLTEWNRD